MLAYRSRLDLPQYTQPHPPVRCEGCIYAGRADGYTTCDYILIKHKQRPCVAGDGCTAREGTSGPRKQWDEQQALKLLQEGHTDRDVSEIVGATEIAIKSWRYRNKIPIGKRKPRARKRENKRG